MDNKNIAQLRKNVQELIWQYGNGQSDYGEEEYPNLTVDQWFNYCVPEIYNMWVKDQGNTYYGDGICDHLRFLGNDVIREVIMKIAEEEGLVA